MNIEVEESPLVSHLFLFPNSVAVFDASKSDLEVIKCDRCSFGSEALVPEFIRSVSQER